jgi:hypothetical protein
MAAGRTEAAIVKGHPLVGAVRDLRRLIPQPLPVWPTRTIWRAGSVPET